MTPVLLRNQLPSTMSTYKTIIYISINYMPKTVHGATLTIQSNMLQQNLHCNKLLYKVNKQDLYRGQALGISNNT